MHVKPLSHQAAFPLRWHRVFLFSRATLISKENPIFFREKGLSWCPNSDEGIAMELTWCSIPEATEFLLAILYACTALKMRALRFHWIRTALKVQ